MRNPLVGSGRSVLETVGDGFDPDDDEFLAELAMVEGDDGSGGAQDFNDEEGGAW